MSAAFGTVKCATRPATQITMILKEKFKFGLALCQEIDQNASVIETEEDGKELMKRFFDKIHEEREGQDYTLMVDRDTAQEETNFFTNDMESKTGTDWLVVEKYSRSQIILKDDEQVPEKYKSKCIVAAFDFSDQTFDNDNQIVATFFTTSDDNTVFALVYMTTENFVGPSWVEADGVHQNVTTTTSRYDITFSS
jgi:hypothetical protein